MLFNTPPPDLGKKELFQKIENMTDCPLKNSGVRIVYPVGDGSSGLMLIGEAPGAKEDKLGEPFVGASGKILNDFLLPAVDLTRKNIYLTNIVKCRPPNNRDPLESEKKAWSKILILEIMTIKPKVIACLGRHALSFFMPKAKIGKIHGKPHKLKLVKNQENILLPLYHPAAALYNPKLKEQLLEDFLVLQKFL